MNARNFLEHIQIRSRWVKIQVNSSLRFSADSSPWISGILVWTIVFTVTLREEFIVTQL